MATASSSAFLRADMRRGTIITTSALILSKNFPLSKFAPLAIWAFKILSASSAKTGTNLIAMVITIPISWPIFLAPNVEKILSIALAESKGGVVAEKFSARRIMSTSLSIM